MWKPGGIAKCAAAIAVTIAGVLLYAHPCSAQFDIAKDNYGLSVSVDRDNIDLGVADFNKYVEANSPQLVTVSTNYHMGYNLTLSFAGGDTSMKGFDNPDHRIPMCSGDKDSALGYWGVSTIAGGDCDMTKFAQSDDGILIDRQDGSDGVFPDKRAIKMYYGVKAGLLTPADTYSINLKYTVTEIDPGTPVIKILDPVKHEIGSSKPINAAVQGIHLEKARDLWIDLNNNSQEEEDEKCLDLHSVGAGDDTTQIECTLPTGNNDMSEADAAVWIRTTDDEIVDTGHKIRYYYQPKIGYVKPMGTNAVSTKDGLNIVDIISDGDITTMLASDGDVYQWRTRGNIDSDITDMINQPHLVNLVNLGGDPVIHIGGYNGRYFAVTKSGSVYGWGDNTKEILVPGDSTTQIGVPTWNNTLGKDTSGVLVGDVFAGRDFVIVQNQDKKLGSLYSWGVNDTKQLGRGEFTGAISLAPNVLGTPSVGFTSNEAYGSVAVGSGHGIAATNMGRLYSWGAKGDGDYGDGRLGWNTKDNAKKPHNLIQKGEAPHYLHDAYNSGQRFVMAAAGDDFSMALSNNGRVYTFGNNSAGQLGVGNRNLGAGKANDITGSFNLSSDGGVVGITARGHQAAAWTENGKLYTWGNEAESPTPISINGSVRFAAVGESNNYAVTSNDQVWQWSKLSKQPVNITRQISHPTYQLELSGQNLAGKVSTVWVDMDGNRQFDDNKDISVKYRPDISNLTVILPTDELVANGNYDLCVSTPGDGVACAKLTVASADGKEGVAKQRQPVKLLNKASDNLNSKSDKSSNDDKVEGDNDNVDPDTVVNGNENKTTDDSSSASDNEDKPDDMGDDKVDGDAADNPDGDNDDGEDDSSDDQIKIVDYNGTQYILTEDGRVQMVTGEGVDATAIDITDTLGLADEDAVVDLLIDEQNRLVVKTSLDETYYLVEVDDGNYDGDLEINETKPSMVWDKLLSTDPEESTSITRSI